MEITEIILDFDRKHFEAFYFKNGHEKLFFSPTVKKHTKLTLMWLGICMITAVVAYIQPKLWWTLGIGATALCLTFITFMRNVFIVLRWKKSVKVYLDHAEKYKSNKLSITNNSFSLIRDGVENIERWSEFKRAELSDEMIILHGNSTYSLPKKCMSESEFEFLRNKVSEKIKLEKE